MINTTICYEFPGGLKADALLSVPFKYLNSKHISLTVNGIPAEEGTDYDFENAGTVRLLREYGGKCSVVLGRTTPPSEDVFMAWEELRDALTLSGRVSEEKYENLKAEIYERLELVSGLLKDRLEQYAKDADNRLEGVRAYAEDKISALLGNIETLAESCGKRFADTDKRLLSFWSDGENFKKEQNARVKTIALDFGALIGRCFNGIAELKESGAELENKLNRRSAERPAALVSHERAAPFDAASSRQELIDEIRSALNTEIQVRRREDAQIKTVLKRLLEKYQRLEDWAAGRDPDLSPGVIGALREEMERRCDTLGRVHLENIVRINDLKSRALDPGPPEDGIKPAGTGALEREAAARARTLRADIDTEAGSRGLANAMPEIEEPKGNIN